MILHRPHGEYMAGASWKLYSMPGFHTSSALGPPSPPTLTLTASSTLLAPFLTPRPGPAIMGGGAVRGSPSGPPGLGRARTRSYKHSSSHRHIHEEFNLILISLPAQKVIESKISMLDMKLKLLEDRLGSTPKARVKTFWVEPLEKDIGSVIDKWVFVKLKGFCTANC